MLLTAVGSVAIVSIASVVAAARTVVAAVSLLGTAALRRCAVLSRRTGLLGRAFGLLRGGSVAVLAAAAVLTVAAVFTAVFAAVAVAAAAAFGVVEARDAVLLRTERRFVGFGFEVAVVLQLLGALAGTVERQNLLHARDGQRDDVGHRILAAAERHRSSQNVALHQMELPFVGQQRLAQPRELLAGIGIGVVFVHQAALELRALSGELLGVERDVLRACGSRGDAREARHPRGAAQLAAAGAQTADAARLLARSDLLHLDADVEPLGEDLDELAEVDALVGYVVEDGLDFVALVLHVADFHVQTHVGGDLPRGNHRLVFEGDGLLPAFDVVGLSLAVDFLVLAVVGGESRAAHLAGHQVARQRDDADVVARRGLDGDDVAPLEVEVVDVLVERAARILEAHLHDVARQVDGIILEPRGFVELEAPLAGERLALGAAVAEAAAASHFGFAAVFMVVYGLVHGVKFP